MTAEHWVLVQHEPVAPLQLEADVDENGVARPPSAQGPPAGRLSRFYFADAVNPVTPAELAAAHHHGDEHEAIEPSAPGGGCSDRGGRERDRVRGARGPALTARPRGRAPHPGARHAACPGQDRLPGQGDALVAPGKST